MRVLLLAVLLPAAALAENWPSWRGDAAGSGSTPETDLPLRWSASENVLWKGALPAPGNSTPVVWENRLFVTQAVGDERLVLCFDAVSGKKLWQSGVTSKTKEETHPTNTYASASPVTDGDCVVAWFGSAGLHCWDISGRERWHLDLGQQEHEWGYASSPVLHGDLCLLYFGPGERSFLVAVSRLTGKEVWRVDAPDEPGPKERTDGFAGNANGVVGSFTTPIIIRAGAAHREELVMTFPGAVRAFVPETGKELWRCRGLTPLVYASPMFGEDVVVAMAGFHGSELAVRPGGEGDVTDKARLWHHDRTKLRLGSGVISGGHVYILNTPGVAQCLDLKTGESLWEERLSGSGKRSESWSSMVRAGDRIYVLNQAGDTFVLRAAPKFELLATNPLNDGLTNSSHAIANGRIYIRTHKHLWCIGEGKPAMPAATPR